MKGNLLCYFVFAMALDYQYVLNNFFQYKETSTGAFIDIICLCYFDF